MKLKMRNMITCVAFVWAIAQGANGQSEIATRQPNGKGELAITGELKQWHKITLTLDGPLAHERDTQPNPFTDLAFNVMFTH